MKEIQRDHARSIGVDVIAWAFDPLQAGNAHFNLRRLGATASRYLENMYGRRADALNRGVPTDRLIAEWPVDPTGSPAETTSKPSPRPGSSKAPTSRNRCRSPPSPGRRPCSSRSPPTSPAFAPTTRPGAERCCAAIASCPHGGLRGAVCRGGCRPRGGTIVLRAPQRLIRLASVTRGGVSSNVIARRGPEARGSFMRRLVLVAALVGPTFALAADRELPHGFSWSEIASGFTGATAMAVAPDGRVFVCEQTGTLRVVKDGRLLDRPFLRVEVDSWWERGLIGVALDPNFASNGFVYVCYVAKAPYPHHKVSRFTARGDVAAEGSEAVLLEGDDQNPIGGQYPFGHQGGALHFGGDGHLYLGLGEQSVGWPAQRMDMLQGKLVRIRPDGTIPADNPFVGVTKGKYRAIWALGLPQSLHVRRRARHRADRHRRRRRRPRGDQSRRRRRQLRLADRRARPDGRRPLPRPDPSLPDQFRHRPRLRPARREFPARVPRPTPLRRLHARLDQVARPRSSPRRR